MKSIRSDAYSYTLAKESGSKRTKWRLEDYVPYFMDDRNSNRDIAMELGVDESTVGRYRKKWLANQTLLPVTQVEATVSEEHEELDTDAVQEQMQYLFRQHLLKEKMRVENDLRKEEIKKRHLDQVLEDDMDWRHYNMGQLNYLSGLTNG